MKSIVFLFIVISCSGSKTATMEKINNTPVDNFELERYLGTWYEIARFPHSFEKDLTAVTAKYSLKNNGRVEVINSGYRNSPDGPYKEAKGKAKIAGDPTVGHLKVSFFLFFYSDYYVLELDQKNYEYALVGSSSSKYLWIMSRKAHMPEGTYNMLVEKAAQRGYNTDNLIKVEQKPLRKFEQGKTI